MQSSMLESVQDRNRTNSAQEVCSSCKSHVNVSIFMDHLHKENKRNSTINHVNDEVNSLLDMFPHIAKKKIADLEKKNISNEEVVELIANENLENVTSEKGNVDLISINNCKMCGNSTQKRANCLEKYFEKQPGKKYDVQF